MLYYYDPRFEVIEMIVIIDILQGFASVKKVKFKAIPITGLEVP
jgi:hypothetical protein